MMKKFILVAVMLIIAWGYYKKEPALRVPVVIDQVDPVMQLPQRDQRAVSRNEIQQAEQPPSINIGTEYKCDGRQYCSQMNSRAEAEFFLKNCPNTKMDGDHDGIPCENDPRF